jgi:hypothetical protein
VYLIGGGERGVVAGTANLPLGRINTTASVRVFQTYRLGFAEVETPRYAPLEPSQHSKDTHLAALLDPSDARSVRRRHAHRAAALFPLPPSEL